MTKLEKELIFTFNNIPVEKMDIFVDCINPTEFAISDKAAMKKIKNKVNSFINNNPRSKSNIYRRRMISMAAVATLVLILTLTISKTARAVVLEPIKKIIVSVFHYVPGEGLVEEQLEEEVVDEVILVNDLNSDASAYYILKNEGDQLSNSDIKIELQRATLHGNTIEISCRVELLKVDEKELNNVLMAALEDCDNGLITPKYLSHYEKYYTDLGYDKYFRLSSDVDNTYDAVKEPLSELKYNGNTLTKIESRTIFGETSDGKNAVVTEKYTVENYDISKEFILSIAGLAMPIELKYSQEYQTQEDLIKDYNGACLSEGISFIATACRTEDKLKVEIHPIDMGQYDKILRFWPVAIINGKEYLGYISEYFREEDELCTNYEFDIPAEIDINEFEIRITDCMVVAKTGGITIELPEKRYGVQTGTCNGEIDRFDVKLQEASYLSKDEADSIWGDYAANMFSEEPGDRIDVKLQVIEKTLPVDDNLKFYGFQRILVNNDSDKNCKVIICGENRSEYCIYPLVAKEEINSLLFIDPIYIIKNCGNISINLQR